jgi:hypothetical protein
MIFKLDKPGTGGRATYENTILHLGKIIVEVLPVDTIGKDGLFIDVNIFVGTNNII